MAKAGPPPPLGAAMRHLREVAGLTRAQLELKAGLGHGTVSKLEGGTHHLDRSMVEALAGVLGFDGSWIDRTLAAVEQLPRHPEPAGSPSDLTEAETRLIQSVAADLSQGIEGDLRSAVGPALVASRWQVERDAATSAWRTLCRHPTIEERRILVKHGAEFHTWAVCERLCDESARATTHDLDQARSLAELAVVAAERSAGCVEWRGYLKAYANSFLGYCWLIHGDYQQAENLLAPFVGLWRSTNLGTEGPLDQTTPLLGYCLLLRINQRYEQALTVTEELLASGLGPLHVARLLINKASILEKLQDYDAAIALLDQARVPAVEAGNPRLLCVIDFNRVAYLCECDRFKEAEAQIPAVRLAALAAGRDLDLVRLRWLEARIAEKAGRLDEALQALRLVWKAFVERSMIFDAAQSALELAALELARGNSREVKALSGSAGPLFRGLALPEKLLASIRLFWGAAVREAATAETARHLARDVRILRQRNQAT